MVVVLLVASVLAVCVCVLWLFVCFSVWLCGSCRFVVARFSFVRSSVCMEGRICVCMAAVNGR